MRLLTIIKIIGAVFLAGTPGSLEAEYTLMKLKEMPNSSGNYHWALRMQI